MSSTDPLPTGVRLGIDVGQVRVGVAQSDPERMLATPVETLQRDYAIDDLLDIISELQAQVVVVGLPRSLSGGEGASAHMARSFAQDLADASAARERVVHVRLLDERLTTVSAHQALHASGRGSRRHRAVVDQVAAVMILQTALDIERNTGALAGTAVTAQESTSARNADSKEAASHHG